MKVEGKEMNVVESVPSSVASVSKGRYSLIPKATAGFMVGFSTDNLR